MPELAAVKHIDGVPHDAYELNSESDREARVWALGSIVASSGPLSSRSAYPVYRFCGRLSN